MAGPNLSDGSTSPADDHDRLFAGLSCLTLAYPAIAATERAWTALFAGVGTLAALMLTWGVIHLLRRQNRFPHGDYPVVMIGIVFTALIYPAFCFFIPAAKSMQPLPLLLTPLLLLFQSLPLLRETDSGQPDRQNALRLAILGGSAAALLLVLAALREMLTYGTIFGYTRQTPDPMGTVTIVSIGMIAAGLALGCLRWISGRVKTSASRGGQTK